MKIILHVILLFLIYSCMGNKEDSSFKHKEYEYVDLDVNHIRNTNVTTFIKDGEPITGTVVQELRNGRKNIWNVERGLAVKQTMYYSNGQVRRSFEMKNGDIHGTFVMYYSNGDKYIEQFYDEGEPEGIWKRWNRDGELIESIEH